jgi:regulatory protein
VHSKDSETFQKAKNYAFLLLKFRLRSEKELYLRLKKKGFPEEVIKQTLIFLKDKNFIDDNLFAKSWIESRLKRPLGLRRIKEELKLKGLDKEIIDAKIGEAKKNYCEEEYVRRIAQDKFDKLKGIEIYRAKRRVYALLLRRGFSPEVVIDVVNELCRHIS